MVTPPSTGSVCRTFDMITGQPFVFRQFPPFFLRFSRKSLKRRQLSIPLCIPKCCFFLIYAENPPCQAHFPPKRISPPIFKDLNQDVDGVVLRITFPEYDVAPTSFFFDGPPSCPWREDFFWGFCIASLLGEFPPLCFNLFLLTEHTESTSPDGCLASFWPSA